MKARKVKPLRTPLLSIILPYYNMPETLPRLFDSIMAQSLRSLEVVVVDDGSERSCAEVVEAYKNKGLDARLIRHGKNMGTLAARASGLAQARGSVITFADQDDMFWGRECLERHAGLLLRERADIVHFNEVAHDCVSSAVWVYHWGFPFAASLRGGEILRACAAAHRGWGVHGKLYSRELAGKALEVVWSEKIVYPEDLVLNAVFFSHARLYLGSHEPGYCHFLRPRRDILCIKDYITILRAYVPVLDMKLPEGCAGVFERIIGLTLRKHASRIGQAVGGVDDFQGQAELFAQLVSGVAPQELANVMSTARQLTGTGAADAKKYPWEPVFMKHLALVLQ